MISVMAVGFVLVAVCAFVHYETLRLVNDYLPGNTFFPQRQKVLLAVFAALLSHLCQMALFALGLYLIRNTFNVEVFANERSNNFLTYCYFSAETYTTLGYGDIVPLHEPRLVAGLEALTGLLMISWTASFTYFEMTQYWKRI